MTKILSVIGARPQFVKAAVVSNALKAAGLDEEIIHTGQHYDDAMSGRFIRDLGLGQITRNLDAGSGSHTDQTARMMLGIAEYLDALPKLPSAMVLYGDTNSTIAGAMVAAKLSLPIAHVEAGLRSYNRTMPEEVNRIVTDHLSTRLYCTSQAGVDNLAKEGIRTGVIEVGDVMLDAFKTFSAKARETINLSDVSSALEPGYILATIHRPSNTDFQNRLQHLVTELGLAGRPVVWPVHPRNSQRLSQLRIPANLVLLDPVSYFEMLVLLENCSAVVTDSGGLQKEAYWSQRPCLTLRNETEWIETLEGGWNQLVDLKSMRLIDALSQTPSKPWARLYGDGKASNRIATDLATHF